MPNTRTASHYGPLGQALHWGMAILIFAMTALVLYAEELPRGAAKSQMMGLHKSVGLLLLALIAVRVAWRAVHAAPARAPAGEWERRGAAAVHALLYGLMLAVPLTGLMLSWAAGRPVSFFGWFEVAPLLAKNPALKETLEELHGALAYTLLGLVALHVAASLWHHFVRRDDTLSRMLPGGLAAPPPAPARR